MTGTVHKYGRPVTGPEADIGYIGNGYQRSCVYGGHPVAVIVYALGGWLGEWSGGSPYGRIFMGGVNTGDVPGPILAQTAEFQPSATYSDITGGNEIVRNVTPFVHAANQRFSLGITARNGLMAHSMKQAQFISESNRNFYDKSLASTSTTPTNPIGGTPSYEGHASLWLVSEPSVKPNKPTGLTPSGSAASTNLAPNLTSRFSDANETLNNGVAWDYLAEYQIKVVRVSDGATMWDATFGSTTTERANRTSSRVYGGNALSYNTDYRYDIRHRDRTGLWSDWASSTFSITSLSTVDKPTVPAGFITSQSNPGSITATYRHNANLHANAMEARLLSSGGSVLHTSAAKAVTVAPNTNLVMSWAESGFGAKVSAGNSYQVQVRARDTNNLWSPSWSPAQVFRLNAAPNTPSGLSPSGSEASSIYPLLVASATDPDPEHPTTTLTVKARIKNSAGTVLQTRAMTYHAATGKFRYQTTVTDLPGYSTYRFDTYSFDGHLYSGGVAAEASATKSVEATFVFAAGPSVTITGPADTVSTINPTVTWSSVFSGGASQVSARVYGHRPVDNVLIYDSGTILGSGTAHTLQAGKWVNDDWNNTETVRFTVLVTDSNTLSGTSPQHLVTLVYPEVPAIQITAYPVSLPGTNGTNAVRIDVGMSEIDVETFSDYELSRVDLLADGHTERPRSRVVVARIEQQEITTLLDAEVTSGQLYRYEARQRVRQGNDILASPPSMVTTSVTWDGLILHMPFDPIGHHVELRYGSPDYTPEISFGQGVTLTSPAGGGRVAFFSPGQTHDPSGSFGIATDEAGTAQQKFEALYAIWAAQGGEEDGQPHVVCWREGRGGPGSHVYGIIQPDWNRAHQPHAGWYTVDIAISEVAFSIGMSD